MNENELWKKLDIKGYRARIGTISMPLNDLTEEEVKEENSPIMDLAKRATDYFVTSIREIPNSKTYENSTLPEEVAGIVTELKQEVLPKIEEISQGIDLVKQGQMTLVELRDKFQTVRASMLKCGQELNGLPGYRAYRARTNEANR